MDCSSKRFEEIGTTPWDFQDREADLSNASVYLLTYVIQAFFEWLEELTEEGVLVEMD